MFLEVVTVTSGALTALQLGPSLVTPRPAPHPQVGALQQGWAGGGGGGLERAGHGTNVELRSLGYDGGG